jgi:Tfp pilus assembly major pilin PilA
MVPEADVTAAVSAIVVPVVMFAALPEAVVAVNIVVVTGAAAAIAVKLVENVIAKTPVHTAASGAAKYRSKNPRRKKFPLQRRSIVRPLSDGSYNSVRDEKCERSQFVG